LREKRVRRKGELEGKEEKRVKEVRPGSSISFK
jgi:hypothetical protein